MKEKKDTTSYRQILDETNQLIQISKLPGYEMMYANRPAKMFTGHENRPYVGEKCYKFMMGLEEQCPFCPMRHIDGREEYITEIDNGQQVFTVKTKKIKWEGEDAFIEYATDITALKRAQEVFESQMQLLLKSIPEAQGIFHLNLTKDTWISSNGISRNVKDLKDAPNVDMLIVQIAAFIPDERMKEKFLGEFKRDVLINAYYNGKTEIIQELLSYYDDNSIRWTRITARLLMNPNTGDLECIVYGMDIQDEKMYREKVMETEREKASLIEMTRRDMLTGVYGKKAFHQLTSEYIDSCPKKPFAIVFVDLDYFKQVNDTLGHLTGDRVLIDTAQKLTDMSGEEDIVSRFGGDEFCILIKNVTEKELRIRLELLVREMRTVYREEDASAQVSISAGAVLCQDKVQELGFLMDLADKALYQIKENGRDGYSIEIC